MSAPENERPSAAGAEQAARDAGEQAGQAGEQARQRAETAAQQAQQTVDPGTDSAAAAGRIPRARGQHVGEPAAEEAEGMAGAYGMSRSEPTGWVGWIVFAGTMLIMVGIFKAIWGLVGIFRNDFYAVRPSGLVVQYSYTAWGWTMLIFGAVMIIVGAALFSGKTWARVLATVLAGLSIIANFVTLGAYPLWSMIMIAMDILAIYAIVVHGREMKTIAEPMR